MKVWMLLLLTTWSVTVYHPTDSRMLNLPDSCVFWTSIKDDIDHADWAKLDRVFKRIDFLFMDLEPFLKQTPDEAVAKFMHEEESKRVQVAWSWMIADIHALLYIARDRAREGSTSAARAWLEQAYCLFRLWEPQLVEHGRLDVSNQINNDFRRLAQAAAVVPDQPNLYNNLADDLTSRLDDAYKALYNKLPLASSPE